MSSLVPLHSSYGDKNFDQIHHDPDNYLVNASSLKMFYNPNIPFNASAVTHKGSDMDIPKAFIERSASTEQSQSLDKLSNLMEFPCKVDKGCTTIYSYDNLNSPSLTGIHLIISEPCTSINPTSPQKISTDLLHTFNGRNKKIKERTDSIGNFYGGEIPHSAYPTTQSVPLVSPYDVGDGNMFDKIMADNYPSFGTDAMGYAYGQPQVYLDPPLSSHSVSYGFFEPKNVEFSEVPKFSKNFISFDSQPPVSRNSQSFEPPISPKLNLSEIEQVLRHQEIPPYKSFSVEDATRLSVPDMAKDQHGSRFIQQRIEGATVDELSHTVNQLIQDTKSLVVLVGDVFGNYVIQKLLDHGNDEHRYIIISSIRGSILSSAVQMYGCRVIQKAIECGNRRIQNLIIDELKGHVFECIKDQNGNHVIQKCIEKIPSSNLQFMIDEISSHVVELSTHSYGCRVIQRILEHFNYDQKYIVTLELYDHVPTLVQDQYGNYVVQHILDHCKNSPHRLYVFNYICRNLFDLSSHKFASNVVEKSLVSGNPEECRIVVNEIFKHSTGAQTDMIFNMMKDQYANYVIQKLIDVIIKENMDDLFTMLVNKVKPHYHNLKKINYGKHIINKIDKINSKFQRNPIGKAESFDTCTVFRSSHNTIENCVSKSVDSSVNVSAFKNQNHVFCDSLAEFPSLVSNNNNKMSITSD